MKLKRIISALVVFTMVMTCAVCSVSAAEGTYNVTTTYEIGTDGVNSGNITVNAAIAGGTEGSMVSYLIVAPYDVTTGEGEEATTTTVYDVKEDGSNILHIDQATVNASGAATMDSLTASYAYLKGGKVKFVSTADTLSRASSGTKPETYIQSVEYFSDVLTGITIVDEGDNGEGTGFYYVTTDGKLHSATTSTNLTAARWDDDKFKMSDWYDGDITTRSGVKLIPIEDVTTYIVNVGQAAGRDKGVRLRYKKYSGAVDGASNTAKTFEIYNSVSTNEDGTPKVDLTINGIYKEDVTDGKFGSIVLEAGAILALDKDNAAGTANTDTPVVEYMAIDSKPIYGTYKDNDGDFMSVTFLVTAPSVEVADVAGLKITAYPKGTLSFDGTIADSSIEPVELGICPNAYTGETKFAIQLFDGANSGQLDPAQWDIEAVPVINEGTAEAPNWVELSVLGDNPASYGKYYEIDRLTQYTEAE